MTTALTFIFSKQDILDLAAKNPDYYLVNVGYELLKDEKGIDRAALAINIECFEKGTTVPLSSQGGCPVPPCRP